jgi:UDP-glucuronate decarboxylase
MRHDITVPLMIHVDEIYHLACPASPMHYQLDPIKTIETNVLGTMTVLKIALETNAKILLTSTSEVYGDPLEHPQKESYNGNVNCCGPRACYDEGKRVAEALMCSYGQQHNVDIRIARIFNTYGPLMNPRDGRVVSNIINQTLHNLPITIYGNGLQTRSFCYIDDMVEGLVKLMKSSLQTPVNIGNPVEITMLELVKNVKHIIPQSSSVVTHNPLPQDDPNKRKPDITKAINC